MLSIRALSNAGNYAYYLQKENVGEWMGEGSKLLDRAGEVDVRPAKESGPNEFNYIRRGEDPRTGERLKRIRAVDRIYTKPWGQEVYKAREVYDLIISAPKSVSIQALFDQRLLRAHNEAVKSTVRDMEKVCGPMTIAAYQHKNSRALDPHLHTHLLTANLSPNENGSGHWRSLKATYLYRRQAEFTEHYRHELLSRAQSLGYSVSYPELAHVPEALMEKLSQRSKQRDEAIQTHMEKHGMTKYPSNNEIAIIVYNTRPKKARDLSEDQIRTSQFQRFTPEEKELLRGAKEEAKERVRERKVERLEVGMHRWGKLLEERASPYLMNAIKGLDLSPYQASVIARTWSKERQGDIVNMPPETRKLAIEEAREKLQSPGPRIRPNDHVEYEPGLERESWDYGERIRP